MCPQQNPAYNGILLLACYASLKLVCIVWRTFYRSQQCSTLQPSSAVTGERSVCCRCFEVEATSESQGHVARQAVACEGVVHLQDMTLTKFGANMPMADRVLGMQCKLFACFCILSGSSVPM